MTLPSKSGIEPRSAIRMQAVTDPVATAHRVIEMQELLRDVATSGVSYDEPRVSYVEVQIDRETWQALAAYRQEQR